MDLLALLAAAERLEAGDEEGAPPSPSNPFQIDDLLLRAFQFLDVATLIRKKPVCKDWKRLATQAIDYKCSGDKKKKKAFQSNQELKDEVKTYCQHSVTERIVENIASSYGYPMDKWYVSNVTDFSEIFKDNRRFNEAIGSWDVSNATTMGEMFSGTGTSTKRLTPGIYQMY